MGRQPKKTKTHIDVRIFSASKNGEGSTLEMCVVSSFHVACARLCMHVCIAALVTNHACSFRGFVHQAHWHLNSPNSNRCPNKTAMGVPAYGTEEYDNYLKKQMLRRRRERTLQKKKKAAICLKTELRELRTCFKDAMVKAEKSSIRANHHMKKCAQHQSNEKSLGAEIAFLKKMLAAEKRERKALEEELVFNKRLVSRWSGWWDRVKKAASPRALAFVYKLGRPPRSTDNCWGGGQ